jgi:hypothetical protein
MRYAKPLILVLVLVFAGCGYSEKNGAQAQANIEFLDGDVLLQHKAGKLSKVIADITKSKYSHCGIVVHRDGKTCVIEGTFPVVCYRTVEKWIEYGIDGYYTHFRPRGISKEKIRRVIEEAEKLLKKPYDFQYELDEKKIYCSELVYKAFLRGAGVEIGKKEKLGDLDWKQHELFIRCMAKGSLPLDRVMVTPESVAKSPRLELVQTTFPEPE